MNKGIALLPFTIATLYAPFVQLKKSHYLIMLKPPALLKKHISMVTWMLQRVRMIVKHHMILMPPLSMSEFSAHQNVILPLKRMRLDLYVGVRMRM